MPKHPLAEVFGFLYDDMSIPADRGRRQKLCPFNNKVPQCTKDKVSDPLGTCIIFDGEGIAVTCPVRLRQDWMIASDAAEFFFPDLRGSNAETTVLSEVRLKDADDSSAGNIDHVIVRHERGRIIDYGSLEVQTVYISGNVRRPFHKYMENPEAGKDMDWTVEENYPRADYLSSSRKRLVPQLIYKGNILQAWGRKMAVAMHTAFFNTLPALQEVPMEEAEIAWLVYGFERRRTEFKMVRDRVLYTKFKDSLTRITTSTVGSETGLIQVLQKKLREKLGER